MAHSEGTTLMKFIRIAAAILFLGTIASAAAGDEPKEAQGGVKLELKTRNVLLVTTDGLRWQEVFGGADSALLNKENGGVGNPSLLATEFGGDTPELRRKRLMPFLWNVIAKEGQIFGNVNAGSEVRVTNGKNFSYPGYNEILTGFADSNIDSNDKVPNRNVTVLEWLNTTDTFRNRVAAFGSWGVFPYIINRARSRMPVVAGWEPLEGPGLSKEELLIGKLMAETPRMWEDCCYDSFTYHAALEYFKRQRPRVVYIGLGETDEFAHEGRYDHYLHSARNVDQYLSSLWETVQGMPDYRGATTMIVTTDHGRGNAPVEWRSHGAGIAGSDKIWIAVIGPDTSSVGERTKTEALTQSQVAATVGSLLGLDYRAFAPKAAPPIASVVRR
jgi:hypothetical protein